MMASFLINEIIRIFIMVIYIAEVLFEQLLTCTGV